jgi:acylphosphatase
LAVSSPKGQLKSPSSLNANTSNCGANSAAAATDGQEISMPGDQQRLCLRCLVSGRVQGVFFRASTREQAQALGIGGHARNLPDGRVEVLACGLTDAVQRLRAWLLRGPPQAQVRDVACESLPWQDISDFTTG